MGKQRGVQMQDVAQEVLGSPLAPQQRAWHAGFVTAACTAVSALLLGPVGTDPTCSALQDTRAACMEAAKSA